jgi:hypothetical protein
MDRLSNLRGEQDPVLSELALGFSHPARVAERLYPVVEEPKESGKIPAFGKDAFKLGNTLRAIRAASNVLSPEGVTFLTITLNEHDIAFPIDYREGQEADFNLEKHATYVVTGRIDLRREKDAGDLAQNVDNYPTGNKITLSGTSQFTHASSTPVEVFDDAKEGVRRKIGKEPNRAIIGPSTFKALKRNAQILDRIKYSQKGVLTLELLQEILDIPEINVGREIYADEAGVFHDVWGDNVIMAYVPDTPSGQRNPYDPSFGYTVRKRGGYPKIDKYVAPGGKLLYVRNTDIFTVVTVGSEAGYIIADTNL